MSTVPAPRDYVQLPQLYPGWKIADVGPGNYPLKQADVYIDRSPEILAGMPEGKETILGSIEDGLPMIPDRYFDYAWCSHVLEHVQDPLACAATLSRIARSGTIVVPSMIKEALFNFEEPTHIWLCLPHPSKSGIVFLRQNREFLNRVKDIDVQKIACRLYRTGTSADLPDDQYLRLWYKQREPDLDVVLHWYGEATLMVIE